MIEIALKLLSWCLVPVVYVATMLIVWRRDD
jgi:hypothetical protein